MNYRYKKNYRPPRDWKERREASLVAYEMLDVIDKSALDQIIDDIEPTMRNAGKDTVVEILAAIGRKVIEMEDKFIKKSILNNMILDQGFYRLATGELDRIFTEAVFGFALYELQDGNTYKHAGVCATFDDAYAWLTGNDEIEIIKVFGDDYDNA